MASPFSGTRAEYRHAARRIAGLKWSDVSFERGVITVMQTKTLRLKAIALNEASREALNWLQANRYGDMLFIVALGRCSRQDYRLRCL